MIVDALKTRLNITCFFDGYDGMPVTWMEVKPDALLKIIVYYRSGKVRRFTSDDQSPLRWRMIPGKSTVGPTVRNTSAGWQQRGNFSHISIP